MIHIFNFILIAVQKRSATKQSLAEKEKITENIEKRQATTNDTSKERMSLTNNVDITERLHVIGIEGEKILLPCNVTTTNTATFDNDSIDLILWFRGQDTRALYSIDARQVPTMQRAKHFSDDELGARAYIDLSTRLHIIILVNLNC